MFLKCSTNNKSATVMNEFYHASTQFGVPSRVRSDKGGENILVFKGIGNRGLKPPQILGEQINFYGRERLALLIWLI